MSPFLSHGKSVCEVRRWNFFEEWGLTAEEFWAPIDAMGAEFWENLEPYPWATDLVRCVRTFDENARLLTTPSRHESSGVGKKRWRDRYFPGMDMVLTEHKALFVRSDQDVLIDDKPENVGAWQKAGGTAMLFSQPWNDLPWLRSHDIDAVSNVEAFLHRVKEPPKEGDTVVSADGGKQAYVAARLDLIPPQNLLLLGECLGFGARKYGEYNWHGIPMKDNLNHAMVHLTKWMAGDRSEPHLVNTLARVNFALWHAIKEGEQSERYIHPDMGSNAENLQK